MNEKLDYKFGKYDLDFLIKLKAHEFRKQKIDNISEKEIRNYLFNIKWKSQKSLPMCDICLLYTSPSPRDAHESRMPSSA